MTIQRRLTATNAALVTSTVPISEPSGHLRRFPGTRVKLRFRLQAFKPRSPPTPTPKGPRATSPSAFLQARRESVPNVSS